MRIALPILVVLLAGLGVGYAAFVAEVNRQFDRDIPIWENKVMRPRPVLCDGDGPIGVYRKWAEKHYPAAPRS